MDQPSLYDDDIVTRAGQQASTLRGFARRPDLSAPGAQSTRSWPSEVIAFQAEAKKAYVPGMRQRIEWSWLRANARIQAETSLQVFDDHRVAGLPDVMPFTPDEIVSETFTMDWALERIASTLYRPTDQH